MPIAYAFEAKSIQSYVLDGGKLRDMAGASALVDELCNYTTADDTPDLLGQALAVVCWPGPRIARRAGGAVILLAADADRERVAAFRHVWTLLVQLRVPGLAFVDAVAQAADEPEAIRRATLALLQARSRPHPELPATPPFARRSPRTGLAATEVWRSDGELIDASMLAKRTVPTTDDSSLNRKFAAPAGAAWPVRMDEEEDGDGNGAVFPLLADNRYVAVVHADGNRLGEILLTLQRVLAGRPDYAEHSLAFSQAIAGATQRAAAAATGVLVEQFRQTLQPDDRDFVMPMRPILLGGDDLTVIVRGDLAVGFTECFLSAFARETEVAFDALRRSFPALGGALPRALSAGAGIAFVKASQPFHLAHDLAASLAAHAKTAAKESVAPHQVPPSCLAFHRVTTALIDDYGTVRKRELVGRVLEPGGTGRVLEATLNPYLVAPGDSDGTGFASLAALLDLVALLADREVSRGPLRRLVGLARAHPSEGRRIYERWREVVGKSPAKTQLESFDELLKALGCRPETAAVVEVKESGRWRRLDDGADASGPDVEIRERSPLLDALNLLAVVKGGASLSGARPAVEAAA